MIKDLKANACPIRSVLYPVLLWLRCFFISWLKKKKKKSKGLADFLTPGGSSQPQNLVQKLENCEATRNRKKVQQDIGLFYNFKVYTILYFVAQAVLIVRELTLAIIPQILKKLSAVANQKIIKVLFKLIKIMQLFPYWKVFLPH